MKFWIIIDIDSEEPIYDDDGELLTFSTPEEAEKYLKEHGINGRIVELPSHDKQ